jgi:hypothetical protein
MRGQAAAFAFAVLTTLLLLISPSHAAESLTLAFGDVSLELDAESCERTSESGARCRKYSLFISAVSEPTGDSIKRAHKAAAASCSTTERAALAIVTFNGHSFAHVKNSRDICFAALAGDASSLIPMISFHAVDDAQVDLAAEANRVMGTVKIKNDKGPGAIPTALMDEPGARDNTRILVILGIAIGILVSILIARHFVLRHRALREHQLTRKDQIAGLKCVVCKRKIVAENDALPCSDCKQPVHKDCLTKHAIASHGPDAQLYR